MLSLSGLETVEGQRQLSCFLAGQGERAQTTRVVIHPPGSFHTIWLPVSALEGYRVAGASNLASDGVLSRENLISPPPPPHQPPSVDQNCQISCGSSFYFHEVWH